MERKRMGPIRRFFSFLSPLIIYYCVSTVVSGVYVGIFMLQAGFEIMEANITHLGIYDYILKCVQEQTMEMVLVTAVIAAPIFAWMYARDLGRRIGFSFAHFQIAIELKGIFLATIGSAILALVFNLLIAMSPLVEMSQGYEEVSEALYAGSIWMQFLGAGIGAAIVEELMMRGVLYGRLREIMKAPLAIIASALIFGIFHGNIVQGVYAFLMGSFFAYLMERYKTIWIPILAHMSANCFMLFLSM